MGYDRGDSFSFDFEPNGIQFSSKSKGKRSPRSYPIQCERNWKTVLSVMQSRVYTQSCPIGCTRWQTLSNSCQIKSNWIIFVILQLILNQTVFRTVQNRSDNGEYSTDFGCFHKNQKLVSQCATHFRYWLQTSIIYQ